MSIDNQLKKISNFKNLELLANQVVEGFISGMHKSPFHGFSAEFAEHKIYNSGESTKHIDWKLYAKSDRLYTKKFEEETNLRCHLIVDNSTSMHYPVLGSGEEFYKNKIGFSVMAAAVLMSLLKKQRDAVGLSLYSDHYEYYAPEKGSDRHHRMILDKLENLIGISPAAKKTDTVSLLHQIAEKIHRRSLIILFTDMFQHQDENDIFKALQHLKHNKHKVVIFHVFDRKTELHFDFDNAPKKFVDVETGEEIELFSDNIKERYENTVTAFFSKIKNSCMQYKIQYVPVSIEENFEKIMLTYLTEKQSFL